MSMDTDVQGTGEIVGVRVGVEVTLRFQHDYNLTNPLWKNAIAEGTQFFMNELEKMVRADIRDEISTQLQMKNITMTFKREGENDR